MRGRTVHPQQLAADSRATVKAGLHLQGSDQFKTGLNHLGVINLNLLGT